MHQRCILSLFAILALVGLTAATFAMSASAQFLDYTKIEITTDQIAPNFYIFTGSAGIDPDHQEAAGGRIGMLAGPDGILMVDAQYAELTDKVVTAIKRVSAAPIRFLVNTHIHRDHTGGNANFAKMDVTIFAREELREGMVRPGEPSCSQPESRARSCRISCCDLEWAVR